MGNSKFHKPVVHSMKRRSWLNDYEGRRIYLITISKNAATPLFGKITGDPLLPPAHENTPRVELSAIGKIIDEEIDAIPRINDKLRILAKVVMLDHIHFVIYVTENISRHIGKEIAVFKRNCTKRYWATDNSKEETRQPVFEANYTDSILKRDGQLSAMIGYVLDNPRRRALIGKYPDFFMRRFVFSIKSSDSESDDLRFKGIGNAFLMRCPNKVPVMVRSMWTDEEFSTRKEEWLQLARDGAVLVSPFYSKREKEVRDEALAQGSRLIVMRNQGFPEKFKPSGKEFDLCSEGRLLMLVKYDASPFEKQLDRKHAMHLNDYCRKIAESLLEDISMAIVK